MMDRIKKFLPFCLIVVVATMVMVNAPAYAEDKPADPTPLEKIQDKLAGQASDSAVCTNFAAGAKIMNDPNATVTSGTLADIYTFIKTVVNDATKKLFNAFTNSQAYQTAVSAALVLMVVFFGVGFTIGVVQVSFGQVLTRLVKIAVVGAIISPGGWTFFNNYVVTFFADGTDDLIKTVMAIGTGSGPAPAGATPFYQLDNIVTFILQPQTIILVLGSLFAGGPFALGMGGLLIMCLWSFFKMVVGALQTYAISYVARALILGVAPIFFVFLLFERTKNLFTSWVNALVNLSLRPILLFTFLSFFMVMIQSAATDMLGVELCWSSYSGSLQGTSNQPSFWRFQDPKTKALMQSQLSWKGPVECMFTGKQVDGKACAPFPINIIDILSFLILVYLAQRFTSVIDQICSELSNAFVSLEGGSSLGAYLQQQNANIGRGIDKTINPINSPKGGQPTAPRR